MEKTPELPKKKKRGRPPILIDYAKVESYAARGMTKGQIAAALGINYSTLAVKQNEDPLFLAAIEKGTAAGIAAVTGMLFKNINLGKETSIIFYLKCRAAWKETLVMETKDLSALPGYDCTDQEAEQAYIDRIRGK